MMDGPTRAFQDRWLPPLNMMTDMGPRPPLCCPGRVSGLSENRFSLCASLTQARSSAIRMCDPLPGWAMPHFIPLTQVLATQVNHNKPGKESAVPSHFTGQNTEPSQA